MSKGYFEKVVCGFRETWHDRLGTEKIAVSGTDGSVRRHKGPSGRFLLGNLPQDEYLV